MEYFTLLTQLGAAKIAAATAANTTVNLTHIAVGDGNGVVPMPDASKTALVNEVFRTNLNDLKVDTNNDNWVVTEGYISSNDGNFWIREVGIFDIDGDLIAIGNYPETFKPVMADGVAKDLYIKVIIEVSSSDAVTLQIDPSVVLATREFVSIEASKKADLNGSNLQRFKVAPAVNDDEAVNKGQIRNSDLVGGVFSFAVSSVPNGYLECNGATLSRTAYSDLFKVIGETYGVGDGSTTFNIPDLRGEFIRGLDNGKGIDNGRTIGSFQYGTLVAAEMDSVGQVTQMGAGSGSYSSNFYADQPEASQLSEKQFTQTATGQSIYNATSYPTYVGATRPRNIAMMYCIKY